MVGTSGIRLKRTGPAVAIARRFPACKLPMAGASTLKATGTWPPMRSLVSGAGALLVTLVKWGGARVSYDGEGDARGGLEQLGREERPGAGWWRADVEFAGLSLRHGDQIRHGAHWERGVSHQHDRGRGDQPDGCEIAVRVI